MGCVALTRHSTYAVGAKQILNDRRGGPVATAVNDRRRIWILHEGVDVLGLQS